MDPIGSIQPVIIAAPAQAAALVHAVSTAAAVPEQINFSSQSAEQARSATIQKISQQIANVYVVGDQTFSIFKDATGQYITRFTSLRDGKVTYIPEPSLFKLGGSSNGAEPSVKIQA